MFNAWKLTRNWAVGQFTHSLNSNLFREGYLVTCKLPTSGLEPVTGANHVDYLPILTRDYLPIYRRAWSKLAHMPVVHPSPPSLPYDVKRMVYMGPCVFGLYSPTQQTSDF
jgi:hypothetical protein